MCKFKNYHQKKPYISLGCECHLLLCVSWLIASWQCSGVSSGDGSVLKEWIHFQLLKLYNLLCSSHKASEDLEMPHGKCMQTITFRKQLKAMEYPARWKVMLKRYLECQKVMPRVPDQATICDKLGMRMCCFVGLHIRGEQPITAPNVRAMLCLREKLSP